MLEKGPTESGWGVPVVEETFSQSTAASSRANEPSNYRLILNESVSCRSGFVATPVSSWS